MRAHRFTHPHSSLHPLHPKRTQQTMQSERRWVMGCYNRNPMANAIHYKICYFIYISDEVKATLSERVLLDYHKLCELKSSGKLRKFEVGQGEGKSKYIVHWGYNAPFFPPVNKNIYFTSLDNVYHRLWLLAYGNGINRKKFWPMVSLNRRGGEDEQFCGVILYMVREFGFHPLHPNDYDYEYKVTFLQGSVDQVSREENGQVVTLCLRTTPHCRREVKVLNLGSLWKNTPM